MTVNKAEGFKQRSELPSNSESDKAKPQGPGFKAPRKAPPKRATLDVQSGFKKPIRLKGNPKEPNEPAFKAPRKPSERRSSPPAPLKDINAAAVNANAKRTRRSTRNAPSPPKPALPVATFKAPRQLDALADRLEISDAYQAALAISARHSASSDLSSPGSTASVPSSPTFSPSSSCPSSTACTTRT